MIGRPLTKVVGRRRGPKWATNGRQLVDQSRSTTFVYGRPLLVDHSLPIIQYFTSFWPHIHHLSDTYYSQSVVVDLVGRLWSTNNCRPKPTIFGRIWSPGPRGSVDFFRTSEMVGRRDFSTRPAKLLNQWVESVLKTIKISIPNYVIYVLKKRLHI
jgi:hypothetical protein